MSRETLISVLKNLHHDSLIGKELELCWHLGEPLAVGLDYYEEMTPAIEEFAAGKFAVEYTFQTNGLLINEAWCRFFKSINAQVGVSLDGPKEFHDCHRVDRRGDGTYDQVMMGLRLLQQAEVSHYIIAVLSTNALREPDRIFDFFSELGETNICFNIEESEGINISQTARSDEACPLVRTFFHRFLERLADDTTGVWVRDLQQMLGRLMTARDGDCINENNLPLRIVSVSWDGTWTTFSPELIATPAPKFRNFRFGNLAEEPVSSSLKRSSFGDALQDITEGVEKCRAECSYFSLCGGGAPSNKFTELGTLTGTETFACRSMVKSLADGCMDFIEGNILHSD